MQCQFCHEVFYSLMALESHITMHHGVNEKTLLNAAIGAASELHGVDGIPSGSIVVIEVKTSNGTSLGSSSCMIGS